MQAKLLRVLEEGEVERIGGDKPISVDVRVLVATHRNLEALVREGKFRQDLFHRVYVFPLILPPLRERREDIPALVEHFARQVCAQNSWKPIPFAPEAIAALAAYPWPGNVRELRNVVERLMLLATEGEVTMDTVRSALPSAPTSLLSSGTSSAHWPSGCRASSGKRFSLSSSETITTSRMPPSRSGWSAAISTKKPNSWESIFRSSAAKKSQTPPRGQK